MRNIQIGFLGLLLGACAAPDGEDGATVQRALEAGGSDEGRVGLNAIDGYNQPSRILDNPEVNWGRLPLSGQLSVVPWSGSYWPKHKGGIAYRWQTNESHTYETLSVDEVSISDARTINALSPAEKYDLYVGNYDWPLTKRTMSEGSPREASWTGYCHG